MESFVNVPCSECGVVHAVFADDQKLNCMCGACFHVERDRGNPVFRKLKPRVKESEIASAFVRAVLDDAKEVFPLLCEKLTKSEHLDEAIKIVNPTRGAYDLAMAVLAVELQALPNLFPSVQALRLRTIALDVLRRNDNWTQEEIAAYEEVWCSAVAASRNPITPLCRRLLHRLMHPSEPYHPLRGYDFDLIGETILSVFIASMFGRWKKLSDSFVITADSSGDE